MIKNGKYQFVKVSRFEFILFIISMVFAPQYLSIDIRLPIYTFWMSISLYRGGSLVKITKYTSATMLVLSVIAIYSTGAVLLNGSGEVFIFLRYFRALVALIVIVTYISTIEADMAKITDCIIVVLLVHSMIIISEIILPDIKDMLVPFSGVSRIFYPFRANGLVNGYDYAGLFSNIGLLMASYKYILKRQGKYLLTGLLCAIAVLFTSRLNMILMCIVLMIILRQSIKEKARLLSIFILSMFIISGVIGVFLWTITTDMLPELRMFIFDTFDWADTLYSIVRDTYPDNNIMNDIEYQFDLGANLSLIFGAGIDGNVDPGYVQSIYAIGVLGTLIIVIYNIYELNYIKRLRKSNLKIDDGKIVYITSAFLLLFNLVGNFKLQFFFSTSIFELISILIIIYEMNYYKGKYVDKGKIA